MREDFLVSEFRVGKEIVFFTFRFCEEGVFLGEFVFAFETDSCSEGFVVEEIEFHAATIETFGVVFWIQTWGYKHQIKLLRWEVPGSKKGFLSCCSNSRFLSIASDSSFRPSSSSTMNPPLESFILEKSPVSLTPRMGNTIFDVVHELTGYF